MYDAKIIMDANMSEILTNNDKKFIFFWFETLKWFLANLIILIKYWIFMGAQV